VIGTTGAWFPPGGGTVAAVTCAAAAVGCFGTKYTCLAFGLTNQLSKSACWSDPFLHINQSINLCLVQCCSLIRCTPAGSKSKVIASCRCVRQAKETTLVMLSWWRIRHHGFPCSVSSRTSVRTCNSAASQVIVRGFLQNCWFSMK
jgi:hypothetical protein